MTFDPNFAQNGYVYIYYTASSPVVNRVSRFTASSANPDVAEPGSEVFTFDNIPSKTGWHNGGAIHFGGDGRLYVAVGEGHSGTNAQLLDTVSGKLLRINADGSIPTDNPFYTQTTGNNRAIWALGLRNPYCSGWIKSIDLTTKAVTTFIAADATRDPVDVKVAADGSLYYLGRGSNGGLHRVRYVGGSQPPSIVSQPQNATVPIGGNVTFTVSASGSQPLSYQWQRKRRQHRRRQRPELHPL